MNVDVEVDEENPFKCQRKLWARFCQVIELFLSLAYKVFSKDRPWLPSLLLFKAN